MSLGGEEGKYSLGEFCLNLTGLHMLLQLALEEEDVWRAVLNWAKYQAGVTQPTAHWAEEERVRVCQHLTGVINHVRLLLIGVCGCVTFNSFIVRYFSHRCLFCIGLMSCTVKMLRFQMVMEVI